MKKIKKPENALKEIDNSLGEFNFVQIQECNLIDESNSLEIINDKDENNLVNCGIYKIYSEVDTPTYSTEGSSCFDLRAYLGAEITHVEVYNRLLHKFPRQVSILPEKNERGIYLEPGESVLVPTGLIFDIPVGYQILMFPRSGISSKKHMKLANCVGVIDSDYIQQTMICIFNDSDVRQALYHKDRLAQAQILPYYQMKISSLDEPPAKKTSRAGGLGHTGVK